MDQQELRQLENRCIQEQPPWCTAACPLHVDARGFAGQAALGNWDEAWKILWRSMPLAGILGRVCDAPCRERCKRSEAGGAIEIGALERFCVSLPRPEMRLQVLPAREQKVAVVGAGLSGLTAAWDLSRKGYRVHVLDAGPFPGSDLMDRFPGVLPKDAVAAETALLERAGVVFHCAQPVNRKDFIDRCRAEHHAVFLSLEVVDPAAWGLEVDTEGGAVISSPLQATSRENVFAAGLGNSPVWRAAQGRWAATSVDRYLQNVSMTAGRDRDGPCETRLFTSLEKVDPLPPVPASGLDGLYTPDEAQAEASRCLGCECLECVKVCPYLEKFKGYPKKYAREIYNNESMVMGARQANRLINSCSLCGLCEVVCPEDFAMQDLCLKARRGMVERGKMPPSAHEFALLDMAFSLGERFSMARHEPGRGESAFAFFPGCQLSATRPDQTLRVYGHLRACLEGGVGLILGCCGAPARWAGQEDRFGEVLDRLRRTWEDMGRPRIITACSTCQLMVSENLPQVEAGSLWEVLAEKGVPEVRFRPEKAPAVVDPCTTRGRPWVQETARRVLRDAGVGFEELELGREKTECCGFGGLMQNANPDLAREVVRQRAAQSGADYLAACAMCRDSLAAVGKRVLHILDLFYPPDGGDPADAPRVGWSDRQENRARLKERLLKEIWKEDFPRMEEHHKIKLAMSPEVRERLDKRRILDEDIQKVIHQAESTGDRLHHPAQGRYKASFRPYKATFWVEYTPGEGVYEVHNAYAHRMDVVGGGRL